MAEKYAAQYEFYPAEDKHEGDCHRYVGADHKGLSGQGLSSIDLKQDPYSKDSFSLSFHFQGDSGKAAYRQETVKGLLNAAGYTGVTIKTYGNASGFSADIDGVTPADLMHAVAGLAKDAPKGSSDYHYAVLQRDIAGQIIEAELARTGQTAMQAGLVSISTEVMTAERAALMGLEKPSGYVDVDMRGCPLSVAMSMREDGFPAAIKDKSALYIETRIEAWPSETAGVQKALLDGGIKITVPEGGGYLRAQAPADEVANVLEKAGLMPPAVAADIRAAAEKTHPDQAKINRSIEAVLDKKKPAASVGMKS